MHDASHARGARGVEYVFGARDVDPAERRGPGARGVFGGAVVKPLASARDRGDRVRVSETQLVHARALEAGCRFTAADGGMDRVAVREQTPGQSAADEAGRTGDEVGGHAVSSTRDRRSGR